MIPIAMSQPNGELSGIDAAFSGFVLDPAKCNRLNLEEKRELIHEIAWWSKDAAALLHSFSRRELLEIICFEMGKERKYTGYTKTQMVEHLLKLVSQNSNKSNSHKLLTSSPTKSQVGMKRQRIIEPQLNVLSDFNQESLETRKGQANFQLCQNVACRARLNQGDAFCKRCSCCICHFYDDNKDPSLWLTCGAEPSDECDTCGTSCHLECALKHEKAGIVKTSACKKLDGSYYCISCGKTNGLMRTWRKQLLFAKEARRVDVLCLRMSMGHRILMGTKRYSQMQKTLKLAINMLSKEVGPLDQVCLKMGRGIVNRLSCGIEVQRLCTAAVEAFDSVSCGPNQDCIGKKELPLSKWPTPTSHGRFDLASKKQPGTEKNTIIRPFKCAEAFSSTSTIPVSPLTPCKTLDGVSGQRQAKESDYEHSVGVIKWLEHEGHIKEDFRVKFLTWFSLKASMQERRVVSAFVNALVDDPPSLAGQLIHTFMDEICSDQKSSSSRGLCTRLWH